MSFLGIKDVTISHRKYSAQIRKKEYNPKISKEHTFDYQDLDYCDPFRIEKKYRDFY